MMVSNETGELLFATSAGLLSISETAKMVRLNAGYDTVGSFETALGIDHPRWYHLEHGKWKSPRLLLEIMCDLGYEITITKKERVMTDTEMITKYRQRFGDAREASIFERDGMKWVRIATRQDDDVIQAYEAPCPSRLFNEENFFRAVDLIHEKLNEAEI